jgi:mannose-6-phosphate isomerase-like protein (cupin superfamily)
MKFVIKSHEAKVETYGGIGFTSKELITYENTGSKTMRLALIELPPGYSTKEHVHNCEEIFYIIEGRGVVIIEGKEYPIEAGDAVYIKENLRHKTINTGNTPLRYIFVVSQPLRPWSPSETTFLEK